MQTQKYNLEQLARESGAAIRQIRSFIQQGLMPGAEARGRNAYYTGSHLQRLRNILLLKDFYGLKPSEMSQLLEDLGDKPLEPEMLTVQGKAGSTPAPAADNAETALQYIRRLKAQQTPLAKAGSAGQTSPARHVEADASSSSRWTAPLEGSPFTQLLELLQSANGQTKVVRRSRGETWVEIQITPDMKLVVRGDYSANKIALLEQIVDQLRHFILGGGSGHGESAR